MFRGAPCSLILIVLLNLKTYCLFYSFDGYVWIRSSVLEAATKSHSAKKILLKLFNEKILETLVKLLCVYNFAKDELLLKYFRRKYL